MTLPPMPMISPAGVLTVPFGVVEVCHAGTSLTKPQSSRTVPPRLGSCTCSIPSAASSLAISTIATTVDPQRFAIVTVSPKWSAWPWVSRIVCGESSCSPTAAFGLPVRNGSTSTVASPSRSSKAAWPRKRISIFTALLSLRYADALPLLGRAGAGTRHDIGSARSSPRSGGGPDQPGARPEQRSCKQADHGGGPARAGDHKRDQQQHDRKGTHAQHVHIAVGAGDCSAQLGQRPRRE